MPYFFILPAFVLYVVAAIIIVAAMGFYPPAVRFSRHVKAVLMWSSIGFLVCSLAYVVVMIAATMTISRMAGGGPSPVAGTLLAAILFVGPFVAAAVGLIGGAVIGLWRTTHVRGTSAR